MPSSVSVVIPYYNGSRFIGEALASVRGQTLPPQEIVVVDDGSRAAEAEALDRAAAVPAGTACRVIHLERNRGACVARNIGILRATGTWVALLDCDDLWEPRKLERQMRFLGEHPECRAVHTGIKIHGTDEQFHKRDVRFEDLVRFPCPAFPSALVVHREALFECGLFNPTKKACQDLDLFLRLTSQYPIACVDEPLTIRRVQPDGISRNVRNFWHEADRVYRDYRYVFRDGAAARDALVEVHSDFLQRAIYARNASFAWNVLRRATRTDVTLLRLLARTVAGLVRNRLARMRGRPARPPGER
jgi:teichuronic acid biosynthesis glycosyltransferase TuaG